MGSFGFGFEDRLQSFFLSFCNNFSNFFFIALYIWLGFSYLLALGLSHCIWGQPLNLTGIYFFHCVYDGKRMVSYDVVHDVFVFIMRDARFHVLHEQTHVFLSFTFQYMC